LLFLGLEELLCLVAHDLAAAASGVEQLAVHALLDVPEEVGAALPARQELVDITGRALPVDGPEGFRELRPGLGRARSRRPSAATATPTSATAPDRRSVDPAHQGVLVR